MDEDVVQGFAVAPQGIFEGRGGADGRHPAEMHDGHPAAEAVGLLHVVGGEEDRGAEAVAELLDMLPHGPPGHGVQAHRGLIQEEDRRPVQHGLGDLQAPDHAAGVFAAPVSGRRR